MGVAPALDPAPRTFDLAREGLRALNAALHALPAGTNETQWEVLNPRGAHAVAVGVDAPVAIAVRGTTGYYCGGMNGGAAIRVHGHVGPGVAENMMGGSVVVEGDAGQYAGATARGGLLVVKGNASSRCAISLKGADVVVHGGVGHMSAFMAQSGTLVVLGDAGDALGDSIYEARLFVRGAVRSLGADCVEKEVRPEHLELLDALLRRGEATGARPEEFRRYGSARRLYTFHVDHAGSY